MNTAMMVTRVSLLMVVTGLFAGMWSGDGPDQRTPAELQMARRASTPRLLARAAKPSPSSVKQVSLASIPLPQGIEAGTYLVVDQSGGTQRMTIEAGKATAVSNFVAIDQYTVRQGDRRWHFIRLDGESDRKIAQPMRSTREVNLR